MEHSCCLVVTVWPPIRYNVQALDTPSAPSHCDQWPTCIWWLERQPERVLCKIRYAQFVEIHMTLSQPRFNNKVCHSNKFCPCLWAFVSVTHTYIHTSSTSKWSIFQMAMRRMTPQPQQPLPKSRHSMTFKGFREICARNISWGKHHIWNTRGYSHGSQSNSRTIPSLDTPWSSTIMAVVIGLNSAWFNGYIQYVKAQGYQPSLIPIHSPYKNWGPRAVRMWHE